MMQKTPHESDVRVKKRTLSFKYIILTYWLMLLVVGIQVGIIVFPGFISINKAVQTAIVMAYWAVIAAAFTFTTNWMIKKGYDNPMRKLSIAAKKVAGGDFSVYIEPIHTSDKYDYIDAMILDFNKMVEELGSIETLKTDFIANVSHEIRTPLAIVQNYATLIKDPKLTPEKRDEYADTIISASQKLGTLVTNILKLNKLENTEIQSTAERYDLCRHLCDCALTFEELWGEKNIKFEVDIEDRAMIRTDKSMMEIVWHNLFSNALKFTEPGGKITLKQTSDADSITVTVSDTGCGMNEETLKHIFDKFYQGDTSHSGEGNGLGMALVLRVIELVGGSISVKSELGKGTAFTVSLKINL